MRAVAVGAFALSTVSVAQAQQAALGPTDFFNASLQVVAAVDRFDMGAVWDRASTVMRSRVPKESFVASSARQRALLGAVRTRDWTAISRAIVTQAGGPLPPGNYVTVRLMTTSHSDATREEIVSFHLDPDGQWRLAGYSLI